MSPIKAKQKEKLDEKKEHNVYIKIPLISNFI